MALREARKGWYILSALGIYPLDPVSGHYEIGSPLVKGARLRLGFPYNTAVIEIRVKGYAPDRWRVKRVMLNGNELKDWRVSHADLVKGGVMEFEMDSSDNPCAKADSEPEGACPRHNLFPVLHGALPVADVAAEAKSAPVPYSPKRGNCGRGGIVVHYSTSSKGMS